MLRIYLSNAHRPQLQGLGRVPLGEHIYLSTNIVPDEKHFVTPGFFVPISDLFFLKPLHRFAIDRTSSVSPMHFRAVSVFPKYVLM